MVGERGGISNGDFGTKDGVYARLDIEIYATKDSIERTPKKNTHDLYDDDVWDERRGLYAPRYRNLRCGKKPKK